jgi:hypothetical protein
MKNEKSLSMLHQISFDRIGLCWQLAGIVKNLSPYSFAPSSFNDFAFIKYVKNWSLFYYMQVTAF